MKPCPGRDEIEILLDGELPPAREATLRAHAALCPTCGPELADYERLLATLRRAPSWEPEWTVRERILDRVLPSRIRKRYVQIFGWLYGSATAVLTFGFLSAVSRADVRAAAAQWAGDIAHGSVRLMIGALELLAVNATHFPERLRGLQSLERLFSPLGRALEQSFQVPAVQLSVWAAALVCAALLGWMHARDKHARTIGNGGPHVGVILA